MKDITNQKMKQVENLTQNQAISVLIQASRIAQSKGAYTLEDAELVSKAIKVFVPEGTENTENAGNDDNSDKNLSGPQDPDSYPAERES